MICVSRFFDRASGLSVFVLSNCCVEQTPPLGQSDKCRDRLASASLSNLLSHTPHSQTHLPLPHSATSLPALPLYLKFDVYREMPGLFKVSVVSNYWYSPNLMNQCSETAGEVFFFFFFWLALSSPFQMELDWAFKLLPTWTFSLCLIIWKPLALLLSFP